MQCIGCCAVVLRDPRNLGCHCAGGCDGDLGRLLGRASHRLEKIHSHPGKTLWTWKSLKFDIRPLHLQCSHPYILPSAALLGHFRVLYHFRLVTEICGGTFSPKGRSEGRWATTEGCCRHPGVAAGLSLGHFLVLDRSKVAGVSQWYASSKTL